MNYVLLWLRWPRTCKRGWKMLVFPCQKPLDIPLNLCYHAVIESVVIEAIDAMLCQENRRMRNRTGQQLGNYRLLHLLGQGGCANVYLGEHTHLNTRAAVKVLHEQMEAQALENFLKEAQTIATLKHPHILGVLDFGMEDSTPFLVMEYAPGGTLRKKHPHGSIVPLPTIVSYVKQVTAALQYAHDQQLVHRDVKPENMLEEAQGSIVLGDFGIAIPVYNTQTFSTQEVGGTPSYMAPEQCRGKARET